MPMDKSRYPDNWPQIAKAVKDAAGWKCEACGIEHGTLRLNAKGKDFREILTCAHLGTPRPGGEEASKSDKMDCRSENLAALCTRCHLWLDLEDHVRNRIENLRRRKQEQLKALYSSGFLFEISEEKGRHDESGNM